MAKSDTKAPTDIEREREQAMFRAKWNSETQSFVYGKEAESLRKAEQDHA